VVQRTTWCTQALTAVKRRMSFPAGSRWPLWLSVSTALALVTLVLLVAVAITAVTRDNAPGRILMLPLVLVVPGYALTAAVFPKRSLGVPERLVFSLGLSLVIVVLGGLLLNWTPFGLRASSWAVLLSGITLGAGVVALVRRQGQRAPTSRWVRFGGVGLAFRQGLLMGLAAMVVCAAIAVSRISAAQQAFPGFTQLWILPAGTANAKDALRLGVRNMEATATVYSLSVSANGKVVKVWRKIDLKPHERWEAILVLPQIGRPGAARVEARLYRARAPATIYRHDVLWLGI
jgi:uncharacterized membrane protein